MSRHRHKAFTLPGDPTDAQGRPVDQDLLGELWGAANQSCEPCLGRLLDQIATDVPTMTRLVEISCTIATSLEGDLPGYMTEDDLIPAAAEFKRLARAGKQERHSACARMTAGERRAAASSALDFLAGHLRIAHERGLHRTDRAGDDLTLAQACGVIALVMVAGWGEAALDEVEELAARCDAARGSASAQARLLTDDPPAAVALVVTAVLEHLATNTGVTVDRLSQLPFTPAEPLLRNRERIARIVADCAFPPGVEDMVAALRDLAQRGDEQPDGGLFSTLASTAARVIAAQAADCAARAGHPRPGEYMLGDLDLAPHTTDSHRRVRGSTRREPERRRTSFPIGQGYREEEPVEGPPSGYPADHRWQIAVERIIVERWDAGTARLNEYLADQAWAGPSSYHCPTGVEVLPCPSCGNHENLLVEGRWGDLLTVHCPCGVTAVAPDESDASPLKSDWGRNTLKRLILSAADPAYEARRLLREVAQFRDDKAALRAQPWYRGPDRDEVDLPEVIDHAATDLVQELTAVLQPQLPQRHEGRTLTLLLVEVALALGTPAVRDSEDGRRLTQAVRDLLTDLRQESDRFAPTRRPILEQLREWRDAGGPAAWQAAWDRTLNMTRHFANYRVGDGALTDGCAALTTAFYLIAREEGIAPDQVSREPVRELAEAKPGEQDVDIPQRWEARLGALGHDLEDPSDPVAVMWRHLRTVHPPSDHPGLCKGPAVVDGLRHLLGPIHRFLAPPPTGDTVRG